MVIGSELSGNLFQVPKLKPSSRSRKVKPCVTCKRDLALSKPIPAVRKSWTEDRSKLCSPRKPWPVPKPPFNLRIKVFFRRRGSWEQCKSAYFSRFETKMQKIIRPVRSAQISSYFKKKDHHVQRTLYNRFSVRQSCQDNWTNIGLHRWVQKGVSFSQAPTRSLSGALFMQVKMHAVQFAPLLDCFGLPFLELELCWNYIMWWFCQWLIVGRKNSEHFA